MFEIIFGAFFFLMLAEVILFIFLNLPFPKSWKSVIFKTVTESPSLKTFLKVQLLLCILAGLFYYDMVSQ
jgi:tellurite resistance protein TehA-like permease